MDNAKAPRGADIEPQRIAFSILSYHRRSS